MAGIYLMCGSRKRAARTGWITGVFCLPPLRDSSLLSLSSPVVQVYMQALSRFLRGNAAACKQACSQQAVSFLVQLIGSCQDLVLVEAAAQVGGAGRLAGTAAGSMVAGPALCCAKEQPSGTRRRGVCLLARVLPLVRNTFGRGGYESA